MNRKRFFKFRQTLIGMVIRDAKERAATHPAITFIEYLYTKVWQHNFIWQIQHILRTYEQVRESFGPLIEIYNM